MATVLPTGAGQHRGRGHPSRITEHFDTVTVEGQPPRDRTVADAIVDLMRLGNYMETAALFVGVSVSTVKHWLREGDKALGRREAGARRRDLSSFQRHAADFLTAVRAATAESERRDVGTLAALARGGLPVVQTTERWITDEDGQPRLVERTTVRRESLPDVRAITWRLERRFPDRWARAPEREDDTTAEADDEFGDDPVAEALRALEDTSRRQDEGTAALMDAGLGDIIDAEVVDERPPEDR
jgi:hypothetical protein